MRLAKKRSANKQSANKRTAQRRVCLEVSAYVAKHLKFVNTVCDIVGEYIRDDELGKPDDHCLEYITARVRRYYNNPRTQLAYDREDDYKVYFIKRDEPVIMHPRSGYRDVVSVRRNNHWIELRGGILLIQ